MIIIPIKSVINCNQLQIMIIPCLAWEVYFSFEHDIVTIPMMWHSCYALQIEEEQQLINELRKIEARKKEREKKTQDLQKLINADTDARKMTKTTKKKIQQTKVAKLDTAVSKLQKNLTERLHRGNMWLFFLRYLR